MIENFRISKKLTSITVLSSLALLALLAPTVYATGSTTVTISGQVSIGTLTVTVRAHASGTASSLSGGGTDSPPPAAVPPGNPGVCQFPLSGSTDGTTVTLSGTVTQSSVHSLIGTPVSITADTSGSITFVFDGLTLTGTGTVVISTS
jgi:hypothetical protein